MNFAASLLRSDALRPEFALVALELSRLSGVVAVSPIPWSNTPKRIRVGLILFLLAVVPAVVVPTRSWTAD